MGERVDVDKAVGRMVGHAKDRVAHGDPSAWKERLASFIEKQPGVRGTVSVRDLRAAGGGAGSSSGTLLFSAEFDAGEGRRVRNLVLRFRPSSGVFHTYDLASQFRIHQALHASGIPVPRPFWLDPQGDDLGSPGFVMEWVEGAVPDQAYFSKGVLAEASPEAGRAMISDVIASLAKIHSTDWHAHSLGFLAQRASGSTPIESEINWYWDGLSWARPDARERLAPTRQWLLENQPPIDSPVLIHGDTNLANYMFRDGRVVAVLDWEMACLATPECDLTFQLFANAVLSQGMDPLPGIPTEEEWRTEYEQVSGRRLAHWDYYYTLSIYRTVIILQMATRDMPAETLAAHEPFLRFFWDSLEKKMVG